MIKKYLLLIITVFLILLGLFFWIPGKKNQEMGEEREEKKSKKQKKEWKDIHIDFNNNPDFIEEWKTRGFNLEECQGWISVGLKPKDSELVYWLVKVKGGDYADPQKFLDNPTDQISEGFIKWKINNTLLKENFLKSMSGFIDITKKFFFNDPDITWQKVMYEYQSKKSSFSFFK